MPAAKVIDDGTYAVLVGDVAVVYKVTIESPPKPTDYLLTILLKGVGKPTSPQLRFASEAARDAFYAALVTAMS
jgi:hypothetical protein